MKDFEPIIDTRLPTNFRWSVEWDRAWRPTFEEFAELLHQAVVHKLSVSHTHFGDWSFWRSGGKHVCIGTSGESVAFIAGGNWVTKAQVYGALEIDE